MNDFDVNLWFLSLSRRYRQAALEEAEVSSVELEKRRHELGEAKSKLCILCGTSRKAPSSNAIEEFLFLRAFALEPVGADRRR